MKTLVAYFSKSGVTGECAKKIAEILGADTFEIKTEKQYPPGFIKTIKVCRKEMNSGERPALVGTSIRSVPVRPPVSRPGKRISPNTQARTCTRACA